jgi:hypothetical protein
MGPFRIAVHECALGSRLGSWSTDHARTLGRRPSSAARVDALDVSQLVLQEVGGPPLLAYAPLTALTSSCAPRTAQAR